MNFSGELYLTEKDKGLHQKSEVIFTQSQRKKEGEKHRNLSEEKVLDWLKVLEKTHLSHNKNNPEVLDRIKNFYHKKYILPYKDEITKGAALVEARAARQLGHGNIEYEGEVYEQRQEIAITDLEKSLDQWIEYLTDPNEPYPMWFRYYVFTNVVKMGSYDLEKKEFRKRGKGTFFPFPDIDRGALAHVQNVIMASKDEVMLQKIRAEQIENAAEDALDDALLTTEKAVLFANKPFSEQYAEAIRTNGEITPEMRKETRGEWVTYPQDSDPGDLWKSLQNKGVPWCTRGWATAEAQLEGGDFHVYYTLDKQGLPTIPRIAIRMSGDSIGEVRGVADNAQNLEENMTEIAEERYSKLPGAEKYKMANSDMKRLGEIEQKTAKNIELNAEELRFLYETDREIVGFGYDPDPRIVEIREKRWERRREDWALIYELEVKNIALKADEINSDTVVCLDSAPIKVAELCRVASKKLKIISGRIDMYHDRIELAQLNFDNLVSLEKIGNYDTLIECFIEVLSYLHAEYEPDLLGHDALTRITTGKSPYEHAMYPSVMNTINVALDYTEKSKKPNDLRIMVKHCFKIGTGTHIYDDGDAEFYYRHLDNDILKKILKLSFDSEDEETVLCLTKFLFYSKSISSDDSSLFVDMLGACDTNIVDSVLKSIFDELGDRLSLSHRNPRMGRIRIEYVNGSEAIIQTLSKNPKLLELLVSKLEVPGVKKFLEEHKLSQVAEE